MPGKGEDVSLSRAVITAVADAKGIDPTELEQPLQTVVDGDALDALFAHTNDSTGRVSFQYSGYEVTVSSEGHVELEELIISQAED